MRDVRLEFHVGQLLAGGPFANGNSASSFGPLLVLLGHEHTLLEHARVDPVRTLVVHRILLVAKDLLLDRHCIHLSMLQVLMELSASFGRTLSQAFHGLTAAEANLLLDVVA